MYPLVCFYNPKQQYNLHLQVSPSGKIWIQSSLHQDGVIIKRAKKDVRWALKTMKIKEIFMFYHLKPWQSWQVGPFSFI
jgi:hypothetical protein